MKAAIIYNQLYDYAGVTMKIGGIETYLVNLAKLLSEMNYAVAIFQAAQCEFERRIEDISVIGVPVTGSSKRNVRTGLFKRASGWIDGDNDLIIFGADYFSVPTKNRNAIAIQHGVSWDLPTKYYSRRETLAAQILSRYRKVVSRYQAVRVFNNCLNRVCVDYNYVNWYRTACLSEPKGRVWVIPNFVALPSGNAVELKSRESVGAETKVLFARRFERIRGTRLMIDAVKEIGARYSNVAFTFAGEGEDEGLLRQELAGCRVNFIKYAASDSLAIHNCHDIAVVPSVGSEGTSLSVIEAMGSGCAVIATSVGGITNLIIDNFNGILVEPDSKALIRGLDTLIQDRELRLRLGRNAYTAACQSLTLENWKKRWKTVIREVSGSAVGS